MLEPTGFSYHRTHRWDRMQGLAVATKTGVLGYAQTNGIIYSSGLKPGFSYQKHGVSMRYQGGS